MNDDDNIEKFVQNWATPLPPSSLEWTPGDRVRDRYTNQTGTVLARTQDCDWAVEWDDGRVTHVDGYDWEPIHPLEDLAQEAE